MTNDVARSLRKRVTPQEIKLWMHLRAMRSRGYHFRRQAPRAGYIIDFVCLKRRVAIELDGSQHGLAGHAARDEIRDARLTAQGFLVLRFWNNDVDNNLFGVLGRILDTLEHRNTAD